MPEAQTESSEYVETLKPMAWLMALADGPTLKPEAKDFKGDK